MSQAKALKDHAAAEISTHICDLRGLPGRLMSTPDDQNGDFMGY